MEFVLVLVFNEPNPNPLLFFFFLHFPQLYIYMCTKPKLVSLYWFLKSRETILV